MQSYQYRIPIIKIRRSHDRLIFNMGIPIPGKIFFTLRRGSDCLDCILGHYCWGWNFPRELCQYRASDALAPFVTRASVTMIFTYEINISLWDFSQKFINPAILFASNGFMKDLLKPLAIKNAFVIMGLVMVAKTLGPRLLWGRISTTCRWSISVLRKCKITFFFFFF